MTRLGYKVSGPKVTAKRFVRDGDSYVLQYDVSNVGFGPPSLRNTKTANTIHKLNKNVARFIRASQAVSMMQRTAPYSRTMVIKDPVLMNPTSERAIMGSKTMKVLRSPCA